METNSSLQRVKVLTIEGIQIGAKSFFWLSLFLEMLLSIVVVVLIFSDLGEMRSGVSILYLLESLILLNLIFWLLGVVPITTIGTIGGALIGVLFAFRKKRFPDVLACFVGGLIGIVPTLFANYLYWQMRSINFHNHYSFLDYLLPLSPSKEISHYYLFVNPYFIPSVISILMWLYVGWRTNKSKVLETT